MRAVSARESPPNFSSICSASTSATIASATTPAAGVVAEAMVALVLAEQMLEKFGGDSLAETSRNHRAYLDRLAERGLA